MKIIISYAILLSISILTVYGQYFNDTKRDYQWVSGRGDAPPPSYGAQIMNFNDSPFSFIVLMNSFPGKLKGVNGAISDIDGALLFFSDGRNVMCADGSVMANGDSLNYDSLIYSIWPDWTPHMQELIILPFPDHPQQYYIIHGKLGILMPYMMLTELCYTLVDMSLNNGKGAVVVKNKTVIRDTLTVSGLIAVRHGNGRDWWIYKGIDNQAMYYRLLLSSDGIRIEGTQSIGIPFFMSNKFAAISPDGNYYAIYKEKPYQPELGYTIEIFAINRCNGHFQEFAVWSGNNIWNGSNGDHPLGIVFSPNSRYLYFNSFTRLWQYDLSASDIQGSEQLIGVWDSTYWYFNPVMFGLAYNAPDGTILYSTWGTRYVHAIEHPDLPGAQCNFVQRKIQTPRIIFGFPDFPHFRLGPLQGSVCDTLYYAGMEQASQDNTCLSVYPNPATDLLRIAWSGDRPAHAGKLEVYSLLSGKIEELYVSPYQNVITWNVAILPNGIYCCILRSGQKTLGTAKFVVSR